MFSCAIVAALFKAEERYGCCAMSPVWVVVLVSWVVLIVSGGPDRDSYCLGRSIDAPGGPSGRPLLKALLKTVHLKKMLVFGRPLEAP